MSEAVSKKEEAIRGYEAGIKEGASALSLTTITQEEVDAIYLEIEGMRTTLGVLRNGEGTDDHILALAQAEAVRQQGIMEVRMRLSRAIEEYVEIQTGPLHRRIVELEADPEPATICEELNAMREEIGMSEGEAISIMDIGAEGKTEFAYAFSEDIYIPVGRSLGGRFVYHDLAAVLGLYDTVENHNRQSRVLIERAMTMIDEAAGGPEQRLTPHLEERLSAEQVLSELQELMAEGYTVELTQADGRQVYQFRGDLAGAEPINIFVESNDEMRSATIAYDLFFEELRVRVMRAEEAEDLLLPPPSALASPPPASPAETPSTADARRNDLWQDFYGVIPGELMTEQDIQWGMANEMFEEVFDSAGVATMEVRIDLGYAAAKVQAGIEIRRALYGELEKRGLITKPVQDGLIAKLDQ